MKRILVFLSFIASSAFADTTWVNIVNIDLQNGYYDLENAPDNVATRTTGDQFALLMRNNCSPSIADRLYIRNEEGKLIKAERLKVVQVDVGTWTYYKFAAPETIAFAGVRMQVDTPVCSIDFWQKKGGDPTPTQPGIPLMKHCEKVAFDLKYEYDNKIEQAVALAATGDKPCTVFVRFSGLMNFRFFLDKRREQNLSPDFEILQPENVKVDLNHAVVN